MQDRAHTPDLAAAPDLGPSPAPAADLGFAMALLQHLQASGRLTPNDVAAALQRYPRLREAVLHVVAAHGGIRGVQALVGAEAQLHGAPVAATALAVATGPAATQVAAPAHTAANRQVAEHDALNAVITVVARGADGQVVERWRARCHGERAMPSRYDDQHAIAPELGPPPSDVADPGRASALRPLPAHYLTPNRVAAARRRTRGAR